MITANSRCMTVKELKEFLNSDQLDENSIIDYLRINIIDDKRNLVKISQDGYIKINPNEEMFNQIEYKIGIEKINKSLIRGGKDE